MKLELLDAYNIRARLSASVILLAPIAITLFLCFEELRSFASCTVILFVLLAFTNYVPILQRRLCKNEMPSTNYAAKMLSPQDNTFDKITKARYYNRLSSLDESLLSFSSPDDSNTFQACCESAVLYLRSRTREDRLVQEENINYGFCKNLMANKTCGIIACILSIVLVGVCTVIPYKGIGNIPTQNYIALGCSIAVLIFWIIGVRPKLLENAAIHYAKALIMAIDTL